MPHTFSALSRRRMLGVHPDLLRCAERAIQISQVDFMVVEGVRNLERQKELVAKGASRTMNSRHLTGHAIDLCAVENGTLQWGQPQAGKVADAMKAAAAEFDVPLEWGGDWKTWKDTPHFQLPWDDYPAQDTAWKDQPKPQPEKAEVKQAMRQSRKYSVSGFFKWLLTFVGISTPVTTWHGAKVGIDTVNDIALTAQALWSSYGMLAFAGVCIVAAIVLNWLQLRQEDDFKEGRYTPSGAEQ